MSLSARVLVGITQRVVSVPSRGERRDTLDQSWTPFLAACGIEAVSIPNRHPEAAAYLRRLGACGVILSGGGNISPSIGTLSGKPAGVPDADADLAPERDATETALLRASVESRWPVIGVCRGMQVLNVFHGGRLAHLSGHAGTRHALAAGSSAGLPNQFEFDRDVNSFHDICVPADGVATGFRPLAVADGTVEAFMHEKMPHLGIMWHPERNRPFSANDIALFSRFMRTGA